MRGEFLLDDDNDDNDLIMAGHVKKSVTRDGTAGTVVREVLEKPLEAKVVGVVGVGHTRACLLEIRCNGGVRRFH